jgi:hypothetical protein
MRDRAEQREPERVPTAEGLRAITPEPMTPEQVGNLVERARANMPSMSMVAEAAQIARTRRALQERIDQRRNGAAVPGSLKRRAAARL